MGNWSPFAQLIPPENKLDIEIHSCLKIAPEPCICWPTNGSLGPETARMRFRTAWFQTWTQWVVRPSLSSRERTQWAPFSLVIYVPKRTHRVLIRTNRVWRRTQMSSLFRNSARETAFRPFPTPDLRYITCMACSHMNTRQALPTRDIYHRLISCPFVPDNYREKFQANQFGNWLTLLTDTWERPGPQIIELKFCGN